jgi:hypothetical protein
MILMCPCCVVLEISTGWAGFVGGGGGVGAGI